MKYKLFEGYGIELEYMIVDAQTLRVRPLADELLKSVLGEYGSDFENGSVTWSNELVTHVIEIKCTRPAADLRNLEKEFQKNVQLINEKLTKWGACLMPTAAHPFMNPATDTVLWKHDNNEVYARYNTIFNCQGHGWSNLQSTHLNLPFSNDAEFEKLHAAVRLVLPLLPALCASSPVLDGQPMPHYDARLSFYKSNQAKLPVITGLIVPEPVFSEAEHKRRILDPIESALAPYNGDELLDPVWVNSRGAMSRFDRGSIEIRIMDIQECVGADLAIQAFVIEMIKMFVNEEFAPLAEQKEWSAESLASLLDGTIQEAQNSVFMDRNYLRLFDIHETMTVGNLLKNMHQRMKTRPDLTPWNSTIDFILQQGSLSHRILRRLKAGSSIDDIYRKLVVCLELNQPFV